MRTWFVLLIATGSLVAAPVPKDFKKADDARLLVGTWKPAGTYSGWFQFAADGTLQTWSDQPRNVEQSWTWEVVDQKATPKRARITRKAGGTFECVYELDGDTLKFALIFYPEKGLPAKVEVHPALQLFETTRDKSAK